MKKIFEIPAIETIKLTSEVVMDDDFQEGGMGAGSDVMAD